MEYDLVFEGGGAKGLAFAGAFRVLEKRGHSVRRVIGSSAGSIVAAIIAAGYDAVESQAAIAEKLPNGKSRFASFLDTPTISSEAEINNSLRHWLRTELDNPYVPNVIEPAIDQMIENMIQKDLARHILSLLIWGGWYSDAAFMDWLQEKLDHGGRNLGSSTLQEFHRKTGRDLSVVASDLTGSEMLVLNHRTAPTCPTIWAVRMSMGCPFAWPEINWNFKWGKYLGRDLTGHKVVDGGLLSNFPIRLFISNDENVAEIMGKDSASENVIGLLIDETLPVPGAGDSLQSAISGPSMIERFDVLQEMVLRIGSLANTVLEAHDKFVLEAYEQYVCHLPAKGYGALEFDMVPERMDAIIRAGEAAMEAYFDSHES
jgi:predicted acylesterase/phospholipase RssA